MIPSGVIYDVDGRSLTAGQPDLAQETVDGAPYRSLVALDDDIAPLVRIWRLDDATRFGNLAAALVTEMLGHLFDGNAIVLLATSAEAEASIREGLLSAFDLATAPAEAAGHA